MRINNIPSNDIMKLTILCFTALSLFFYRNYGYTIYNECVRVLMLTMKQISKRLFRNWWNWMVIQVCWYLYTIFDTFFFIEMQFLLFKLFHSPFLNPLSIMSLSEKKITFSSKESLQNAFFTIFCQTKAGRLN